VRTLTPATYLVCRFWMVRMVCEHEVLLVKRATEVKSCMHQQPLASSCTMAVSTRYEDNKCNLSLSALCSLGLTLFPSPSSARKEKKEGKMFLQGWWHNFFDWILFLCALGNGSKIPSSFKSIPPCS
jgi:hypothetical protein